MSYLSHKQEKGWHTSHHQVKWQKWGNVVVGHKSPERKPYHTSDRRQEDRPRNRFYKSHDEHTARYTAHETDDRDEEVNRTLRRKNRARKSQTLTTAFVQDMDELAFAVEELEDGKVKTWKICEHFQSPCMRTLPREKSRNRGYQPPWSASFFSYNFWLSSVIFERHWRKKARRDPKGLVNHKTLVTGCFT